MAVELGTAPTTRLFCALVLLAGAAGGARTVRAAEGYAPFTGEKVAWHGFDRYDFLMNDEDLSIKPATAAANVKGLRRCIVVVPKEVAPGAPWSWRGFYWETRDGPAEEITNDVR